MQRNSSTLLVLAFCLSAVATAQDTRTVTEPVIPAFCTKLDAHLTSISDGTYNTLSAADEAKLDTDRIQKAIDGCGKERPSPSRPTVGPTHSSVARLSFAKV